MLKMYEVEPEKTLHEILFDAWERNSTVFINGSLYNTLSVLLAYDTENGVYEIYKKSDEYLENPIATYKSEEIEKVETY